MKKRNLLVCFIIAMFSIFAFGCEHKVAVENIYFNAPSNDGVVLVVGETYTPQVYFSPLYPTNAGYRVISGDSDIVASRNNKITALTTGKTFITVVSEENELIQDVMKVQVIASRSKLPTPTISYSAEKQAFTISSSAQDGFVNGYLLNINGESINIGNVLEYSIADYNKHLQTSTSTSGVSAYDRDLTVKVKAVVSAYTSIYEDSNFSSSIKINQASAPKSISVSGGKLNIEKSKATNYQIYINSVLVGSTDKKQFDLSVVDKNLVSSNVEVGVVAVCEAGNGFASYNSAKLTQTVKCVENVNLNMLDSLISWQNIDGVNQFVLYLNDSKTPLAVTSNSYFDLRTLQNFESLFASATQEYQLSVVPKLSADSKNLIISSEQKSVVKFNRLAAPQLKCEENCVAWQPVAYADKYLVQVQDASGELLLDVVTENRSIDFSSNKYLSGVNYTVTVSACCVDNQNTHYMSSTSSELQVEKVASAQAEIENSILNIQTIVDHEYSVEIYDETGVIYSHIYTAVSNLLQVKLLELGIDYKAGKQTIYVQHLGNNTNTIDSEKIQLEIVQLQAIDDISVVDSVVTAVLGEVNTENNATLSFEICDSDTVVKTVGDKQDLTALDLATGDYQIKLYVLGDGVNTLSVCQNGQLKVCATYDFKVLKVPTITTQHENPQFDIEEIVGAQGYKIDVDGIIEITTELTFAFDLLSGESKQITIQAIGDGMVTINSPVSEEKTFERLQTPNLTFDNTTNTLITDYAGQNYTLSLNNVDVTASYTFGETVTGLMGGENVFEMILLAQDDADIVYINSLPKDLVISKCENMTELKMVGNKLVVTPANFSENHYLKISFLTDESEIVVDEYNYFEKSPNLNLIRTSTGYEISILDELFNPVLAEFANGFRVKLRYVAKHLDDGDLYATSEYTSEYFVNYAPTAQFDMAERDGQKICVSVSLGYSYIDYALIINDTYILNLNSESELNSEDQTLKFDVSYIYGNVPAEILQDVNKLTVVTLNNKSTSEQLLLSTIGSSILISRADTAELSSTKNNLSQSETNSRKILLSAASTDFDRQAVVKVYNDSDDQSKYSVFTIDATPTASSAIKYSFDLDDYGLDLVGVKKIVAYIKTNATKTITDETIQTIYMFDSAMSNELVYQIVDNAAVTTDGAKLYVSLPENVDGVDVFMQTEAGLQKLNTNLIVDNYNFGLNQGSLKIVVKAISTVSGNFTNSQYSLPIELTKLSAPVITIENGIIVIKLDEQAAGLFATTNFDETMGAENLDGCVIRYVADGLDGVKYIHRNQTGVDVDGLYIKIEPSVMLQYGVTALTKESFSFDVIAKVTTGELYLDSNKTNADFYGLFAPKQVKLSAADENENPVQTLSWTDTGLNKLSNGTDCLLGYIFKIQDEQGNSYFSNTNLVYNVLDSSTNKYVATRYADIITTTSVTFPCGYIDQENQVQMFKPGKYFVSVKSMPKSSIAWYNLCCSKYSDEVQITLLDSPVLALDQGVVRWNSISGATEYVMIVEDLADASVKQTVVLTKNSYEFENFDAFNSNYNLTIKAISNKENVVSSVFSKEFVVHRLASYQELVVKNGIIQLVASQYFTQAELTFRNTTTGVEEVLMFDNPVYADSMQGLISSGDETWTSTNADLANQTKTFIITIDESYLLKLSKGSYTLSVKLLGNSLESFGIVNSTSKQENSIAKFVKLAFDEENPNAVDKSWIRVDERGVFTFACPEEYSLGGINYQFNQKVDGENYSFYQNAMIYKLTVEINNNPYELFAIDYYNYIANKAMLEGYYTEFENNNSIFAVVKYPYLSSSGSTEYLYFNVYKENKINLNLDEFYYFQTVLSTKDDQIEFSSKLNTAETQGYYKATLLNGGTFSIKLYLLGGDVTDVLVEGATEKQAFLSSDIYSSKTFIRYTENNLKSYIKYDYIPDGEQENAITYTYSGDLIFQNKLKRDEEDNVLDYPVYQLEISPIIYYDGTATETKPYIYYLYHDEASKEQVAQNNPVTDYTEIKFLPVEYLENNREYLKFEFSKYFRPGNYSIKIRTLAGIGTENLDSKYLLNAKLPSQSYPFKRVSNTSITISNGKLQFDLAYVLNDRVKTYITDYELVLTRYENEQPTEYSYKINQNSEGVTISNNVLTYVLPTTVQAYSTSNLAGEPVEVQLQNGIKLGVKVRAMQSDDKDTGTLNATFVQSAGQDVVTMVQKSQGIKNVQIRNGAIYWQVNDTENYNGTTLRIELADGRVVEENLSKSSTNQTNLEGQTYFYYNISDTEYNVVGGIGTCRITEGVYTLKLLTKGGYDSTNSIQILNSNYTESVEMHRLKKLADNVIVSEDGVLTWSSDEAEHVSSYIVSLSGANSYTFTTDATQIDFATQADDNGNMVAVGKYTITIKAVGSDYITSMPSNQIAGFAKLATPTGLTETDDYISWEAIENAEGYKIVFSWGDNQTDEQTVLSSEELKCVAPNAMQGNYTITLQAIGVGTGKAFNGGIFTFHGSNARPEPVGEISFNADDLSLYIPVGDDFKTNDVIRISYNIRLYEYTPEGSVLTDTITSQIIEITSGDANFRRVIDGQIYYVYPMSTVGKYTSLSVSVVRKGSLMSVATPYEDIDFNYYAYGDGSESTPYGIANATHLLNLAYRADKNFEFVQAIDLSGVDKLAQIKQKGAIIADKFTGSLDAKGFTLFGLTNLQVENNQISSYQGFALFKTLDGAIVKNLNIAETDNNATKFVNTFAQSQSNVLKLSLIAMDANNSQLVNVLLSKATFVINGDYNLTNNAYIGGLVASANGTTFAGCTVNLTVQFDAGFVTTSAKVYIGGVVAYATNGSVGNSEDGKTTTTSLTVTQARSNCRFNSIGGVAGYYVSTNGNASISDVTSTMVQTTNIYVSNYGGIVGHALNVDISGCTVSGSFRHTALGETNTGAVVGQIQAGSVDNCTITLTFDIAISTTRSLYIGFVAGYVSSNNDIMATIQNCKINQAFTNKTTFASLTLEQMGIYGSSSQANFTPTGCTQIDN